MERWERERILGEWPARDGTAADGRLAKGLEEDLRGHPDRGKPLRRRLRNFSADVDRYVASLGGPLPYMQRIRELEDLTAEHERRLADAWAALAHECGADRARFERRWRAMAARWSFVEVNDLIDRHNRNFPAESRLPMDPTTGDFVLVGGKPYQRRALDAAWILERFPARLDAAA